MKSQVIGMIKISSHKKVEHGGRGITKEFWILDDKCKFNLQKHLFSNMLLAEDYVANWEKNLHYLLIAV